MNARIVLIALLSALPLAATAQESSASRLAPDYVEINDLIVRFARNTGRQVIVDPRVRAEIPLVGMDVNKIDYPRLLAILNVHQFAAVDQGGWITILPDANARQQPTPVFTDRNFKAAADELVTLVVRVKNLCATQVVPILRPLMPQAAHMAASMDNASLVLSDHAANVHRIVAVVEALERNAPGNARCDAPGDNRK